jgi:tetratricopeptide (TPR) repeat protein
MSALGFSPNAALNLDPNATANGSDEPAPSGQRFQSQVAPASQVRSAPGAGSDEAERDDYFLRLAAETPLAWTHALDGDVRDSNFGDVLSAVNRAFAAIDLADTVALTKLIDALPGVAALAAGWGKAPVALEFLERAAPLVAMTSADARARFWLARGTLKRMVGEPLEAEKCIAAALEAAEDEEVRLLAEIAQATVLVRLGRMRDAERALGRPLSAHGTPLRAEALRLLATARSLEGRPAEAEAFAREAFRTHITLERIPRPTFVILLATLFAENGRHAEARAHLQAARQGFETAGRTRWVALCDANLGSASLEIGELADAANYYSSAFDKHLAVGEIFEAAFACGHWGAALLLSGQAARAAERLERAIALCNQATAPDRGRFFSALLAVALAHERSKTASERAAAAMARVPSDQHELLRHAMNILAAPRERRPLALRQAGAVLATVDPNANIGFMQRLSLRVLELTMHEEGVREGRVLRVAEDGSWFEGARGRVDLTTRLALRRIIVALAQSAQTSPGALMTAPELIAAGWPGERILPTAARGRLRVAVCTLRKFGLREFLASSRHGHAIEARVELVPVEPSAQVVQVLPEVG